MGTEPSAFSGSDVDRRVLDANSDKHFSLHLALGRDAVTVTLGDIDVTVVEALERLLWSLDPISACICVEMEKVTFIDSSGLAPFMASARRRTAQGLAPVLIGGCSARASRFLQLLGANQKSFDEDGWDRDMKSAPKCL